MLRFSKLGGAVSALALAFAMPAAADDFADSLGAAATGVTAEPCCDDPNDALGSPDASGSDTTDFAGFVTIEDTGTLTLDFDDNICVEGGTVDPDLIVHEYLGGAGETFTVAVGVQGGLLSGSVAGSGASNQLDFSSVAPGAAFNRAHLVSTNNAGAVPGTDVDAMECLNTLDTADIVKQHTGFEDIDVGVDVVQTGFSFTIEITNGTGISGGLAGLTFFDSVPAEFDLDPDAEDLLDLFDDNACPDGTCDGVDTSNIGDCALTLDTSEGAKKKGRTKLEPEHISLTADAVAAGDSCTIEVFVKTDSKGFVNPNSRSPRFTPTSCPEDPGVIVLNDGVRVFDSSMNLLLDDDDMLTLSCNNFTE